jgi:hypothetical protein
MGMIGDDGDGSAHNLFPDRPSVQPFASPHAASRALRRCWRSICDHRTPGYLAESQRGGVMMDQERGGGGSANGEGPSDEQIAREARTMGAAGISRDTGTGSAGSGLAAGGGTGMNRSAHAGTTDPVTDQSGDLADAAGPSGAAFGGTGTAGSGLGGASAAGLPPESGAGADAPSAVDGVGTLGNPKGRSLGGSDAGGGG